MTFGDSSPKPVKIIKSAFMFNTLALITTLNQTSTAFPKYHHLLFSFMANATTSKIQMCKYRVLFPFNLESLAYFIHKYSIL